MNSNTKNIVKNIAIVSAGFGVSIYLIYKKAIEPMMTLGGTMDSEWNQDVKDSLKPGCQSCNNNCNNICGPLNLSLNNLNEINRTSYTNPYTRWKDYWRKFH